MVGNSGSDLFASLFGSPTQGLSLFSNNGFRRTKPENSELGRPASEIPGPSALQTITPKHVGHSRADKEGRMKSKKIKKEESAAPVSNLPSADRQDIVPFSGKKRNRWDGDSAVEEFPSKKAASRVEKQQIYPKELVEKIEEQTHSEIRAKLVKRAFQGVPDNENPIKKHKLSADSRLDVIIPSKDAESAENVSQKDKRSTKRKKDDCSPNLSGNKRSKMQASLESRYEKKLRGVNNNLAENEDSGSMPILQEGEKLKVTGASSGKRKRIEQDEPLVKATTKQMFDTEEKLKRTIFVGNLPLSVKKKALNKEFSMYGLVESVRLRSVPLLDTKIPRRGAIIKNQINETVNSQHAYVVFSTTANANAALAHNMKELCGNHLRVDAAYAPRQSEKGKSSLHYDPKRSIFVGNLPFDVKDEELYQTFSTKKSPELDIEAIRVVRDPKTSASKGIAYVLFKSKAGALFFLSRKRNVKLRERILRIHRVLATQSNHKVATPIRHTRERENVGNRLPERKRAKLSASYEGIRASKENLPLVKDKRKVSDNQQRMNKSSKVKGHGAARAGGTKRKRMEKHQRGFSRSKKIRRT